MSMNWKRIFGALFVMSLLSQSAFGLSCEILPDYLSDDSSPEVLEVFGPGEAQQEAQAKLFAKTQFEVRKRLFVHAQHKQIARLDLVAVAKIHAVSEVLTADPNGFGEYYVVYAQVSLVEVFKARHKRQWLGKLRGGRVGVLLAPDFKAGQTILLKAKATKLDDSRFEAASVESLNCPNAFGVA